MPISKINTGAIHDEAVTTAKIEDDAVNGNKTAHDIHLAGTEAIRVPQGTTAQRANAQAGDIRFNTTFSLMEYYDGTQWKSIDAPPTISSISPSNFDAQGDTLTITGTNFSAGATVKLIGADATEYSASSVTVNSATSISFDITSAMVTNNDPFDIKVTNVSGLSATLEDSVDFAPSPVWTTSAGSLGNIYDIERGDKTFTVAATSTDAEDTITYAITSGALPTGMSLTSSTGVIDGTPNQESAGGSQSYSFEITATATSAELGTTTTNARTFSITVYGLVTQTFEYSSDAALTWSVPSDLTKATTEMWGAGGGSYHDGSGNNSQGGAGGYTKTTFNILSTERGTSWTVVVGNGGGANATAGYGGGGNGANGGGGGGGMAMLVSSAASLTTNPFVSTSSGVYGNHWKPSTEMAAKSGATHIVAIAGGGGGGAWYNVNDRHGAMGGGITGGQSGGSYGGSQTSGGDGGGNYDEPGGFLYGGYTSNNASNGGSGGAGGGWYGGGTYQTSTAGANYGGAGGSGFIGFADGSTSTVLTANENGHSYTDSTTRTNGTRTYTNSITRRSGNSIRTPSDTSSSVYTAGSGSVGYGYGSRDGVNENGGNAVVVIYY